MTTTDPDRWWHGGVFYQIYPRSFADSNRDGVGDLPGIISRLDYLAELGIAGIWLSPITVSPDRDWGYDVADYRDVDPDFGALDDLDHPGRRGREAGHPHPARPGPQPHQRSPPLVRRRPHRARRRAPGLVRLGRSGARRRAAEQLGQHLRGLGLELDRASGQYFLHNFEPAQPDLNWWSDGVRTAFDEIVRFWWDRGIAGFRIDVCNMMIKDAELRDNPAGHRGGPARSAIHGRQGGLQHRPSRGP